MAKRIGSSVVGLPILIFVVLMGGTVLQFSILILVLIGMNELFGAISKKQLFVNKIAYIFAIIYILILPYFSETIALNLVASFIVSLLIAMVIFHETITINDVSASLICFFYVAFLMSFIYLVRVHSYGNYFVWLIFISAWGSDTFAYFTGKLIGKHKLSPKLSPNKTVEGAIGGVFGATALGILYAVILIKYVHNSDINIVLFFGVISFVCSIFSQVGDLAASAIKRSTGVKDFGHIIPGHGGIMDRFDSLLFTAPGVYFVISFLLKFL